MAKSKLTEHQRKVNQKWNSYTYRARTKGLPFELTRDEFERLLTNVCYYCGSKPNPYNGIDRRNNSHGYTRVNSVSCCSVCNMAKKVMSESHWYSFIWRASEYIFRSGHGVPEDKTVEEIGISTPNYPDSYLKRKANDKPVY